MGVAKFLKSKKTWRRIGKTASKIGKGVAREGKHIERAVLKTTDNLVSNIGGTLKFLSNPIVLIGVGVVVIMVVVKK